MSETQTPRKATKDSIVGIPMTDAMRNELETLAALRRWSRAEAGRYLIELGLKAHAEATEQARAVA